MSKKQFKSQASSGRAAFGSTPNGIFGASGRAPVFGATSSLSYISDPPVLSNITDPNVVVALKGLSKKDATTKSKALEDLLTYALSKGPESGGVQDGVLEAWTKMYPRTSIDNSRRVRQLAHTLQAQVAVSSGKRIAKHMPKVVGAWLSGLYDSDRLVSRTAREALERVFPSKEKIQNIWRAYERPILEFTRDSVLRETVQTLSDERTVSPDDAEAKYARVVATAISLLSSLLAELEEFPALWTDAYTAKRPAALRLRQYLKRGSQGGPQEVWENISQMIRKVPPEVLAKDLSQALDLLENMLDGISSKGQSREDLQPAWKSYVDVLEHISELLNVQDQQKLVNESLLPMLEQYLANDNFSLPSHNTLWHRDDPRANEEEILDFVFSAQAFWKGWLRDDKDAVSGAREQLRKDSHGLDPRAFYNARAFAYITEELVEVYGVSKVDSESWPQHFREGRIKSDDLYLTIAMSIGFKGPMSSTKVASRLCNELVSDLTGLEYRKHPAEALRMLVLLNAIVQHQDTANDIPPHRLVPFVKSLLDWWGGDDHEPSVAAAAEVAKVLTIVLPVIQDVYGGHWSRTTKLVKDIWLGDGDESNAESRLPAVHASLKLFGELKKIHHSNDDADDAYKEAEFPTQLASLVREIMPDGTSDKMNQPLKVVNSLLCRMLTESGPKEVDDPNEFCRLLYVESASIQLAGFRLLHRLIPAAQEQISLEAALSKKDAHVSEVLLSLLVDAPTLETLAEARWEQSMPLHLRGYLFSWMLVFDHFTNSSYKVRSDYVADLKKGDYLKALLDLTFDFLGHDRGKPVDASKFDIRTYVPDTEESPERDTQWLLTHIYFLCLKNLASLTKAWWIEHAGRHKSSSIETWTEKYVSALVIADELATVSEWVASDEQEGDEQPLKVKVSRNAREVTAGYEVDEQTMEIAIKLPGAYPLGQATVEGLHRVGVDEKRWRSWLLNTQGVITFSNGSIVDGLTAWRKNVTGALKGQTECAICYSIISADKQLPSKRCGTCKNLFHSSCLYKWFKSSNSSSCPLCRNPFNYG
ncbi:MAG: hypothetical protein M1832_000454 [Thelocarpon impressellum]|nr:MAG: hypothetical protein M1832_000454 [Thelocarpon impressellum]